MKATEYVCPRCAYPLVPVHAVGARRRRRVVALTCPEPYCDHVQRLDSEEARRDVRRPGEERAAEPV